MLHGDIVILVLVLFLMRLEAAVQAQSYHSFNVIARFVAFYRCNFHDT